MYESLVDLGWGPHFEQLVSAREHEEFFVARVAAHFGSQIQFLSVSGIFNAPAAIIETEQESYSTIAVGDWYLLNRDDHRALRRLDRKTLLCRKAAGERVQPQLIASNVDTVFIVSSCNQDFNLSRIERYLSLTCESHAAPVVVLTKADLCEPEAVADMRRKVEGLHTNVIVESIDARNIANVHVLDAWCRRGQTVAMLGSSGVGKSTLANTLGEAKIRTDQIREKDAKGRHTTTARYLHKLSNGGWLIDTPGMRELQLADCEQGVSEVFSDVIHLAQMCQFRNCRHQGDSGCALQEAVDQGELTPRRLKSFLKLLAEQARNSESLAERRDKQRRTGQMYKRIISEKQNRRNR